jgi:hypothetical protein
VATFIVQKILLDELGLQYICQTYERFFAVATVLGTMVKGLVEQPSGRLLKHVVRCYLRLSDNPRYSAPHCRAVGFGSPRPVPVFLVLLGILAGNKVACYSWLMKCAIIPKSMPSDGGLGDVSPALKSLKMSTLLHIVQCRAMPMPKLDCIPLYLDCLQSTRSFEAMPSGASEGRDIRCCPQGISTSALPLGHVARPLSRV